MKLARFNEKGIQEFSAFLSALSANAPTSNPKDLITDSNLIESLPTSVQVERRTFATAFEVAKCAYECVAATQLPSPERDKGLWAWLACFWFDDVCARDRQGSHAPGEQAHWIPALDEAFRYYRHLILGRYLVFSMNADRPERALAFLCQRPHTLGHIYYQIAARQQLITCKAIVEVVTELYYDSATRALKRNSQTYGHPGSVFRLADILMQLDCTIDLHGLTAGELLDLLPSEFTAFR